MNTYFITAYLHAEGGDTMPLPSVFSVRAESSEHAFKYVASHIHSSDEFLPNRLKRKSLNSFLDNHVINLEPNDFEFYGYEEGTPYELWGEEPYLILTIVEMENLSKPKAVKKDLVETNKEPKNTEEAQKSPVKFPNISVQPIPLLVGDIDDEEIWEPWRAEALEKLGLVLGMNINDNTRTYPSLEAVRHVLNDTQTIIKEWVDTHNYNIPLTKKEKVDKMTKDLASAFIHSEPIDEFMESVRKDEIGFRYTLKELQEFIAINY